MTSASPAARNGTEMVRIGDTFPNTMRHSDGDAEGSRCLNFMIPRKDSGPKDAHKNSRDVREAATHLPQLRRRYRGVAHMSMEAALRQTRRKRAALRIVPGSVAKAEVREAGLAAISHELSE